MNKDEKDPPLGGSQELITMQLCEAYRKTLQNEIHDIKDDVKQVDKRLWATLAGVIISILLLIMNLVAK